MSSKRPGGGDGSSYSSGGAGLLGGLLNKKKRLDSTTAAAATANAGIQPNRYLSKPVSPEEGLQKFLLEAHSTALRYRSNTNGNTRKIITSPFCEVEARLGILKVPRAVPERRVTSSGAKTFKGIPAHDAFVCSNCSMLSGVSRSQFVKHFSSGISAHSPLTLALGVDASAPSERLKQDLVETESVETVYTGYANDGRCCFEGEHTGTTTDSETGTKLGKMESKEKLLTRDFTIPAARFDFRISLASEKIMDAAVPAPPPNGWKSQRIKRRRSYARRDRSVAWQIDVTEVTTTTNHHGSAAQQQQLHYPKVDYEVEMELLPHVLLELINEQDDAKLKQRTEELARQLWQILEQINPLHDALNVEETLRDHPNSRAVQLALAQCGAFKRFMDGGCQSYESPIDRSTPPSPALSNVKFVGCMPVNFRRRNLDEIQRSAASDYYISEKTDGVRYFLIFTGDTAVLVDRAMRGKQPIPLGNDGSDPFSPILNLIKPGTVFDGEVVMNRRSGGGRHEKPRPVFIVFDVLSISTKPVLHLPFGQRLGHLLDMFDARFVADTATGALPLVLKNFVLRTELDQLLEHVHEEHGMRCYRKGELHNHLTDGVIFQPTNRPYVCGTDKHLLKWKYLDTVTIDVEMLPLRHLRLGCLGEEQTRVDMTRIILLPRCERARLEADRHESGGGRICEVGFDAETGEWYYLTMRGDKPKPNHISTVLGSLLELAESLTTDELRYRMSVPAEHVPQGFARDAAPNVAVSAAAIAAAAATTTTATRLEWKSLT